VIAARCESGPTEVLAQARADLTGEGARGLEAAVELGLVGCQPEGLQLGGIVRGAFTDEHELARIRDQHHAVARPVAAHLPARGRQFRIGASGLHLHDAALWRLPLPRLPFLDLPRRVEAEIRMTGALVPQFADAEHLGLEGAADGVQQVGDRRVDRPFAGCAAGRANPLQVGEVVLGRDYQPVAHLPRGADPDGNRSASLGLDAVTRASVGSIETRVEDAERLIEHG